MNLHVRCFSTVSILLLSLVGYSVQAAAEPLFFDDFEDRVADQATVGNNWTWYDQTFDGDTCTGEPASGYGPYDDGDGSDYEADNRNFVNAGSDESYYRAGLEVPAWSDEDNGGVAVVLDNMLRVYGNQYNAATSCERVLIFQERTIDAAGNFVFSFDVAKDRYGAPAAGEITAAFVKVLIQSDSSYDTVLFETVLTKPPVASTPFDVTTASQSIEFMIPEEYIGELLQFGFYNDFAENLNQSWGNSAALYDNVMLAEVGIGPAHSGTWYNGSQRGHGFSIEFGYAGSAAFAVVYWYTYDSEGNPIFMIGQGAVPDGNRLELAVFQSPVGMKYGEFDPESVSREDAGTAVFEFIDRDHATFSYTPSDFSESQWGHTTPIESLELVKLFGIPAEKYFDTTQ